MEMNADRIKKKIDEKNLDIGIIRDLTYVNGLREKLILLLSKSDHIDKHMKEVLANLPDRALKKREQAIIFDLCYRDYLTGLYNRRYFQEYLENINSKVFLPTSMLMIDVNGLKLTNDTFGYVKGDELLKKVTEVLRKACPEHSMIARIGGDEFVVIIENYAQDESYELANRIYQCTQDVNDSEAIISISIGYETRTTLEASLKEVLIKAENYMFRRKLIESQSIRHQTVLAILNTLKEKNEREKRHSEQVGKLARKIGEAMGLTGHILKEIETTGLLHDIGKISVRESVLNKPGKLSEEEYEEIKRHAESGYRILKTVDQYSAIADNILAHHERVDGTGYPKGLKGEEIPIISRIIFVADAYEAMVANRTYRMGISHEQALEELKRCSGTQFDSAIVNVFIGCFQNDFRINETEYRL